MKIARIIGAVIGIFLLLATVLVMTIMWGLVALTVIALAAVIVSAAYGIATREPPRCCTRRGRKRRCSCDVKCEWVTCAAPDTGILHKMPADH